MIIKPKIRGFICTTTHPTGCKVNVEKQIEYVKQNGKIENGPSRVLVIGASTGYGLASRISAAFGSGAATIGVFFEKPGTESKPVQQAGITPRLSMKLQSGKVCIPKALTVMRSPTNVVMKSSSSSKKTRVKLI